MGRRRRAALTVIQMLKMLERFPIGDASQGYGFGSVNTINVMADAMRLAFADRGDVDGRQRLRAGAAKGLLNHDLRRPARRGIVPGARLTPNPMPGDPRPYETAGCTPARAWRWPSPSPAPARRHHAFLGGRQVGQHGQLHQHHRVRATASACLPATSSEDGSFQSHGFLLNNELTDFNTAPTTNPLTGSAGYNDVQPDKRPRSSMAPTMIFTPEGKPFIAYGSPGGATIINSVLNVTLNLIDHR